MVRLEGFYVTRKQGQKRASSFPEPNLARRAFTAGGGPAFFSPGFVFMLKVPTWVEDMSSRADSNTCGVFDHCSNDAHSHSYYVVLQSWERASNTGRAQRLSNSDSPHLPHQSNRDALEPRPQPLHLVKVEQQAPKEGVGPRQRSLHLPSPALEVAVGENLERDPRDRGGEAPRDVLVELHVERLEAAVARGMHIRAGFLWTMGK